MDIIISINKPKDITSHDAVANVKRILQVKKAGHTGTLDPMATGLMLICLNKGTRLAKYFTGLDKEYRAVMKLGEATDTQDACGKVISSVEKVDIKSDLIRDTLKTFTGKIRQQPPMFSALKHKGKPLYTMARKGIEIERKDRDVTIYRLDLEDINLPYVTFTTLCSKGTYIRTLCDDIGKKLGVGAHLSALERTAIGNYRLEDSISLEQLEAISQGKEITQGIYSLDEALSWLPQFEIKNSLVKSVTHGNQIKLQHIKVPDEFKKAAGIRIKSPDGILLAIGSYAEMTNIIKMDVVLA